MRIIIPFKTPSVNHLYFTWQNRRILTKEARNLQKTIKELVPKCNKELKQLRVEVTIIENWYNKNGTIAKKDVANREKFLIDAIFKALEIDDSLIFVSLLRKVQSTVEEKSIIEIEELNGNLV